MRWNQIEPSPFTWLYVEARVSPPSSLRNRIFLQRTAQGARMSIDRLKDRLPDHARDLRINLGAITSSTTLKPQQAWGIALASAVASRNAEVVDAIASEARLSPEAAGAARGAASIMAMNNIYYRFQHMMGGGSAYADLPARLRMQIIGRPGVDSVDFELWCLAASVIAGCENSVRNHENMVRERGGTAEQVQDAVRIASVIHAVALTLDSTPLLTLEEAAPVLPSRAG